jgi:hypothetical protein
MQECVLAVAGDSSDKILVTYPYSFDFVACNKNNGNAPLYMNIKEHEIFALKFQAIIKKW